MEHAPAPVAARVVAESGARTPYDTAVAVHPDDPRYKHVPPGERTLRALVLRLKRIEGQLRGIQKLIETDADCEKVAQQLAAARKALDKSFFTMVGCVIAQGDMPPDDVADMLSRFS